MSTNRNVKGSIDSPLSDYEKLAEKNLTHMPIDYQIVEVHVNLASPVLESFILELHSNLEAAASLKGGVVGISLDEFRDYVHSLIATRIQYVRGDRAVFRPTDSVVIPSYLSVLLENLGQAIDHDLGVELVPCAIDCPLKLEEIYSISRKLRVLGAVGFEYSDGYSRDRTGSWDFMSMTLIEDEIQRHNGDAHPVYAILASTIGLRGVETALSPRVKYGNAQHLASVVRSLASLKH